VKYYAVQVALVASDVEVPPLTTSGMAVVTREDAGPIVDLNTYSKTVTGADVLVAKRMAIYVLTLAMAKAKVLAIEHPESRVFVTVDAPQSGLASLAWDYITDMVMPMSVMKQKAIGKKRPEAHLDLRPWLVQIEGRGWKTSAKKDPQYLAQWQEFWEVWHNSGEVTITRHDLLRLRKATHQWQQDWRIKHDQLVKAEVR
jgi:hypothetical protein